MTSHSPPPGRASRCAPSTVPLSHRHRRLADLRTRRPSRAVHSVLCTRVLLNLRAAAARSSALDLDDFTQVTPIVFERTLVDETSDIMRASDEERGIEMARINSPGEDRHADSRSATPA